MKNRTEYLNFRLTQDLMDKITENARKGGKSMSTYVNNLLEEMLKDD